MASAIATQPISTPNAVFWSSISSFQREPGVRRSNNMKAPMNNTIPSTVKTTPASTFAARFLSTSGVMSLSSQVSAGASVEVRGSVRSRVVAHATRHVLDFGGASEAPPAPLGKAERRDQQHAEQQVHGMLSHHSSSEVGA